MIKSLQGLRVIAMVGIFLFHAGFIPNGIFPVTFFFILSGFVIYYKHNEQTDKRKISNGISYGIKKIKKCMEFILLPLL